MRAYIDTSAYLTILLGQRDAEALLERLAGAELLSSSLLVLEARRTIVHAARQRLLTEAESRSALTRVEEDVERLVLRDLTLDLCLAPDFPPVLTPRSLDLVHLRTALWFGRQEPLDAFVTTDVRQRNAARELGLPA